MNHIHKFMAVVKSYGVNCAVKVPHGVSVVDPAKKFVVRAEGSSARGSIGLRYMDDSGSQIDFWTTLASVRSECKRKTRKGRRCEAKTTDATGFDTRVVSGMGLNKSERIGNSRLNPNGVPSTDVRTTSRNPDVKCEPLVQDPSEACLNKVDTQRVTDSSWHAEAYLDLDYASDDILQQDRDAIGFISRPVNYAQLESHCGGSAGMRFQLSDIPEDAEGSDSSSDSDTEDVTRCGLGETGSECCKRISTSVFSNSGALTDALHPDVEKLVPSLAVHTNDERSYGGGYSSHLQDDHTYDDWESSEEDKQYDNDLDDHVVVTADKQCGDTSDDNLSIKKSAPYAEAKPLKNWESTEEDKQYDNDLDDRVVVTSDEQCGDTSDDNLSIKKSASCAEAKPLKIFVACRSDGSRSPGSASDPAENLEWENDPAMLPPATILNETTVPLPDSSQKPTALGVALTSPRSTLYDSNLCLADRSERSFSSLWEVVTNSRRHDEDHPCHLLGSVSSIPSASIVSIVSKFNVLYGFSPGPIGEGLVVNEKERIYLD